MKKITSYLKAFHDDREGTAMTEFVMATPIFIVIFIGIVDLAQMNRDGVRVKLVASEAMWTAAMVPHKKEGLSQLVPKFTESIPTLAAATAFGKINKNKHSTIGNIRAYQKNLGMLTKSSRGESKPMIKFGGGSGDPWSKPKEVFAKRMAIDDRPRSLPSGGPGLGIFAPARLLAFLGTRHAVVAGTRYGMVQGQANMSGSTSSGLSYNADATYDVLLSPVSMRAQNPFLVKEMAIIGFSRLSAEEDSCLKSVLSITPKIDLKC